MVYGVGDGLTTDFAAADLERSDRRAYRERNPDRSLVQMIECACRCCSIASLYLRRAQRIRSYRRCDSTNRAGRRVCGPLAPPISGIRLVARKRRAGLNHVGHTVIDLARCAAKRDISKVSAMPRRSYRRSLNSNAVDDRAGGV
jgi:hypothetical protein